MIPIKMLSTVNIEDYHVSLLLIVLLTIGLLEVSFIDNQVVPLNIMLKFSIKKNYNNKNAFHYQKLYFFIDS